ncbi:hypothetical protein KW786_01450 [Candidatus Parcubacteria bacterium]|nr:hypothetical protein [Candidatus Parcubacteria bacterium]
MTDERPRELEGKVMEWVARIAIAVALAAQPDQFEGVKINLLEDPVGPGAIVIRVVKKKENDPHFRDWVLALAKIIPVRVIVVDE